MKIFFMLIAIFLLVGAGVLAIRQVQPADDKVVERVLQMDEAPEGVDPALLQAARDFVQVIHELAK